MLIESTFGSSLMVIVLMWQQLQSFEHPNERKIKIGLILSTLWPQPNRKYITMCLVWNTTAKVLDKLVRANADQVMCYLIKSKSYWQIINYEPKYFVLYVIQQSFMSRSIIYQLQQRMQWRSVPGDQYKKKKKKAQKLVYQTSHLCNQIQFDFKFICCYLLLCVTYVSTNILYSNIDVCELPKILYDSFDVFCFRLLIIFIASDSGSFI